MATFPAPGPSIRQTTMPGKSGHRFKLTILVHSLVSCCITEAHRILLSRGTGRTLCYALTLEQCTHTRFGTFLVCTLRRPSLMSRSEPALYMVANTRVVFREMSRYCMKGYQHSS
jgi:hypothetical protein